VQLQGEGHRLARVPELAPDELGHLGQVLNDMLDARLERDARLEEMVEERTSELTAVNRELEAFSYSVSHDLRAPLRAIDGFSQALLEDYTASLDPTAKEYLQRTRRAAQRMGALIDDLLNLSRLTRQELAPTRVDLSSLAREVVSKLEREQPSHTPEVVIAPDLYVRGDAGLLRIALENLMGNAWKYTARRSGARIELGTRELAGETVYFVGDNGVGFRMDEAGKLFEPFQRLHSGGDFEGTGVGLAIVARIVGRHGGRVWADARPGEGANFYFTLSGG
jgi:signal transduction histidine kinase